MPTCRVCGVDPLTWLRHVLTGLPQRREGRGRRLATVQLLQNLCGLTEPHTSPGSSALQRCSSRQCAWKIALTSRQPKLPLRSAKPLLKVGGTACPLLPRRYCLPGKGCSIDHACAIHRRPAPQSRSHS
nr:transposase domain-containing protein [Rhizobium sp. BK226]